MDESVFDIKIVFLWEHRNSSGEWSFHCRGPHKKLIALSCSQKKTERVRDHPRTDAREKKKDNLVIGEKIQTTRGSTKSFHERRRKFRIN